MSSRSNKNKGSSGGSKTKQEEEESEGLALLIPDIQETARIVHIATSRCPQNSPDTDQSDGPGSSDTAGLAQSDHSQEQRYMSNMQELQFGKWLLGSMFLLEAFPQLNTWRMKQNLCHSAGDIFKCIIIKENFCILIRISWKFLLNIPIDK